LTQQIKKPQVSYFKAKIDEKVNGDGRAVPSFCAGQNLSFGMAGVFKTHANIGN
jgi:hypothetical protein